MNLFWEARYRRQFRASMQLLYGNQETENYVKSKIGTPDEAIGNARVLLRYLSQHTPATALSSIFCKPKRVVDSK